MRTAALVEIFRIMKIGPPGIMAQYRFSKPILKMGCYRFEPTGFGHGQNSEIRCLIGPYPVFVSVHFGSCLVAANYRTIGNRLFKPLVNRGCFLGQPANNIVNTSLAQVNPITVF